MSIDLYQIHWPRWGSSPAGYDPGSVAEAWQALADLKRDGKVRYIGASNFTVADLEAAERVAPITSLQPPYSALRRDIEADVLPWCLAHDVGVIVYSPMQSGLLTGTMTRERVAALPDNDWRRRAKYFQEPYLTAGAGARRAPARGRREARPHRRRGRHCLDASPPRRHRRYRRRAAPRSARRHRRALRTCG